MLGPVFLLHIIVLAFNMRARLLPVHGRRMHHEFAHAVKSKVSVRLVAHGHTRAANTYVVIANPLAIKWWYFSLLLLLLIFVTLSHLDVSVRLALINLSRSYLVRFMLINWFSRLRFLCAGQSSQHDRHGFQGENYICVLCQCAMYCSRLVENGFDLSSHRLFQLFRICSPLFWSPSPRTEMVVW